MKKARIKIGGMTCASCAAANERALRKTSGVASVSVNLASEQADVVFDETKTNRVALEHVIEKAGYVVIPEKNAHGEADSIRKEHEQFVLKVKLLIAALCTIPLFYLSMGPMIGIPIPIKNVLVLSIVQLCLTLPVIGAGYTFYTSGFKNLFRRTPNMDTLVAIGTSAAFFFSIYGTIRVFQGNHAAVHHLYFESTAVIITLILLGKYLETKSKGKTGEAIRALMSLAPKTAIVLRNNTESEIPVDDVRVGDIICIKPGAYLPVDGTIIDGATSIDESMLTGESLPVEKISGDTVFAATYNKNGSIRYRADKIGADTTLSHIIKLVEDAAGSKAPIAKLADTVSGIFVPIVILIALLTLVAWLIAGKGIEFSLSIFVSVLVIACPCALGLATPTAIIVAAGKGAQLGILFRHATAIEMAGKIDTIVFDKTGTITEGNPQVTDILPFKHFDSKRLLYIAACAEKNSEHPLADAITFYAQEQHIQVTQARDFHSSTGFGISCIVDGLSVKIGKASFIINEADIAHADVLKTAENWAEQGKTVLFISVDSVLCGLIAVADPIKKSSPQAIRLLDTMHIQTMMLTGDNEKTARSVATQAGINDIHRVIAGVLPAGKSDVITALQRTGKKVAMVGDGINDAPALAIADVGISLGSGTDIAIESADIILVKNTLLDVVTAISLSKATMRNIRQNLFWAFCYNVLGIPIAAGVLHLFGGPLLDPMFAAAAMSLSSVSVLANALRLRSFKKIPSDEKNESTHKIKRKK